MKRTLIIALSAVCIFLSAFSSGAQDYSERGTFIDESSGRSVLYRGRQAIRYNISFEGTPYWDSPEFVEGSITLDGKYYDGVMVNVDAFAGEVQLLPPGSRTAIVPPREHVDRASMGDIKFVNLVKKGYDVTPGFYEIVREGDFTLYRLVRKTLLTDLNKAASLGYAQEYFKDKDLYFFEKDDILYPIGKRKATKLAANPSAALIASAMRARKDAVSL